MNIDVLKCFILVAENLSFARAAEALYISQPAVTRQINALETELGTELFLRSTRHVELTPAGMSFYKDAKEIVQKAQSAVDRLRMGNPGIQSLNMGISNATALRKVTPLLKEFYQQYPAIIPNIEVMSYKTILNLFMENKLDILFYYKQNLTTSAGIRFVELLEDSLMCLLPKGHPLAKKEEIGEEDICQEVIIACNPLNAALVVADLQQRLLKQHPSDGVIYCNTVEVAHCMVGAGMGISVLPKALCPMGEDSVAVPFKTSMKLSFGCFYHTKSKNQSLHRFLSMIKSDNRNET